MPNREVLIVKNISREGPGLFEGVLLENSVRYSIIDVADLDKNRPLGNTGAVIVLGGPASANDLDELMLDELAFVRRVLREKIPYLGICLGHQILVKATGGKIVPCRPKEIGFRNMSGENYSITLTGDGRKDPLFSGLDNTLGVFQLHGETVEPAAGTILLATSLSCRNQVVKAGNNAYGIQAHFELDASMLETWLEEDEDLGTLDPVAVRKDFAMFGNTCSLAGKTILKNFLSIASLI
ncbi:MAG: type 1 glutamine amidotransferase [Bacteroidales bacterium]